MNSIEAKGRNVEEAIKKALKVLKTEKENVIVEVLEQAEDRLFGLFVKPAVVKVTLKESDSPVNTAETKQIEQEIEEATKETHLEPLQAGMIEISNGMVRHFATEEKKPVIIPCENLIVTINGKQITSVAEIQPNDSVEIEHVINAKENGKFEIRIDEEKLHATLIMFAGFTEQFVPTNVLATTTLELKAQLVQKPYISFTKEDILQQLHALGVTFGIDEETIDQAVERQESCELVIAKGIPPVQGEDGYVEFYIQYEVADTKPKVLEDGTVDFREIREIPVVEEGETIGILHPPKEGKQGTSIENKPIEPNTVSEAVVTGKGIQIENQSIIASEAGTIRVYNRAPKYQIDIIEKLVHSGDVDLKSGNLSFTGDIEITGNVEETMTVEANERVLIMQSVHGGTVEAGTELVVNRNIIRSKLTVGKVDDKELVLKEKTGELLNSIKEFERSVLQLIIANRKSGQAQTDMAIIVQVLLEQKFPSLSSEINDYLRLMHDSSENEVLNVNELIELLYSAFVTFDSKILNDEMAFLTIEEKLATLHRYYEQKLEPIAKATIGQAQQSEVFCNGDILLTGRGAYNSKFHAEGKFETNGFIRGGSIYAKKGIRVNEVGSGFGVETVLSVPADETIEINLAKEDTMIQIGKRMYRFVKERENIKAHIDETGTIVLS